MFPMYLTLSLMLLLILAAVGTSVYEVVDDYLYRRTTNRLLARHYAESHMVWSEVSMNHMSYFMFRVVGGTRLAAQSMAQADGDSNSA